jgi:hypothetical protein
VNQVQQGLHLISAIPRVRARTNHSAPRETNSVPPPPRSNPSASLSTSSRISRDLFQSHPPWTLSPQPQRDFHRFTATEDPTN